jgi:hypothetical protein
VVVQKRTLWIVAEWNKLLNGGGLELESQVTWGKEEQNENLANWKGKQVLLTMAS